MGAMNYAAEIAERVMLSRKELGLTQTELAQRARVSRSTVVRAENGDAESISFGAMVRILNAVSWTIVLERGVPVLSRAHDDFDMDAYLDGLYGDAR